MGDTPQFQLPAGYEDAKPSSGPSAAAAPNGLQLPKGYEDAVPAGTDGSARKPGAYQQFKGGPVQNANEDAAHPFSDSTTSVLGNVLGTKPTGAMMKREGESDSQFVSRAVEAGKHVTPDQIEQEQKGNNARAIPTLVAAAASGPALLSTEIGASAGYDAAVEQIGKVPGMLKSGYDWAKANPFKAYVLYNLANEAGIGPKGIMKMIHLISGVGEK